MQMYFYKLLLQIINVCVTFHLPQLQLDKYHFVGYNGFLLSVSSSLHHCHMSAPQIFPWVIQTQQTCVKGICGWRYSWRTNESPAAKFKIWCLDRCYWQWGTLTVERLQRVFKDDGILYKLDKKRGRGWKKGALYA